MNALVTSIRLATKALVMGVPFTREMYFQWAFLGRSPCCKGIYSSFAEAYAAIPANRRRGYHHEVIPESYKSRLDYFIPNDYPVIFWLSQLFSQARLVVDLGGSIGLGYYAYRRYLRFPAGLRWIISDTPEMVKTGREIARERHETQLSFTDRREIDGDPDIYATFGTLQYLEESFTDILAKLPKRPPHLLVNRVPMVEGDSYITLEHAGLWFSPYRVQDVSVFIASIKALGYELVDHWDGDRPVSYMLHPEHKVPRYHGMYFRLSAA